MKEKISIIVRCWNAEKTIRRCLDSIVNQTYDNLEVLVIDDGSTDSSLSIVREYEKNEKVLFRIIEQEHQGIFSATKLGIENASGEWVGFVDADDYVHQEMYKGMLDSALEFGADCVQSENYFLDEDGKKIENQRVKEPLLLEQKKVMEYFINGTSIVRCGLCYKLHRRKLFDNVEWNPTYISEDVGLTYQICHNTDRFLCLPDMYYYTFRASTSLTRKKFVIQKYDLHDVYKRMKEFFKAHKEYEKLVPHALNSQIGAIFYSVGEMYKANITGEDKKTLLTKIKEDIQKIRKEEKCSFKQKFLLDMIYSTPWLYGIIYKLSNR